VVGIAVQRVGIMLIMGYWEFEQVSSSVFEFLFLEHKACHTRKNVLGSLILISRNTYCTKSQ
jgi:hypothetical protein